MASLVGTPGEGRKVLCLNLCRLSEPHVASVPLAGARSRDELAPGWAEAVCMEVHCNGESIFVNHCLNIH